MLGKEKGAWSAGYRARGSWRGDSKARPGSPRTCKDLQPKSNKKTPNHSHIIRSASWDVHSVDNTKCQPHTEHPEPSSTDGGHVNWYSHSGKQFGSFSYSSTCTCHMTRETWKLVFTQKPAQECFRHHSLVLETTQISFNRGADEQSHNLWYTCPINKIKGTSRCCTQQHGYISNAFCEEKEARPRGLHSAWFHSWHPGQGRTIEGRKLDQRLPHIGVEGGELVDYKGAQGEEHFGVMECSLSWLWEGPHNCVPLSKRIELHTKNGDFTTLCFHKKKRRREGRKERRKKPTHLPTGKWLERSCSLIPQHTECWMPTSVGGRAELESKRGKSARCQSQRRFQKPGRSAGAEVRVP